MNKIPCKRLQIPIINLSKITLFSSILLLSLLIFSSTIYAFEGVEREEKVALVTGASRGIGLALTKQLLAEGVHVIAVARKVDLLKELEAQFLSRLQIISVDLSTEEGQLSVAPAVRKKMIDYLVHNAGIIEPVGENALLEASPKEIRRILEVNIIAPIILTNQLSFNLKKSSRILMISSRAGNRVSSGTGLYGVTKIAVDRYAESLKLDHPHDVLAASVHPGDVDTNMHANLRNKDVAQFSRAKFFQEKKSKLISPKLSAQYLTWLLLKTSDQVFSGQKHNIYDKSHHAAWANGIPVDDPYQLQSSKTGSLGEHLQVEFKGKL